MSNTQIAEQYARQYSKFLKKGGVWPHNLHRVADTQAILAIYRKYFSKVTYDTKKDICICVK
jgi:hypothetical protein